MRSRIIMDASSKNNSGLEELSAFKKRHEELEEKLAVLRSQHEMLKTNYRDLKTQYARLSTQAMRLQRNNTRATIHENEIFLDNQYLSMHNSLAASRMQELTQPQRQTYHMITDNIAIGDVQSDYGPFDIIINANFMGESLQCKHHDMTTKTNNGKQITYIAMYDNMNEKAYMKMILHCMIPTLVHHVKRNPHIKILFHCYAGISRSGAFGVAFMAHFYGMSYEMALQQIKEKREVVDPNPGFVEAVKEYLEEIREVESMIVV